MDQKSREFEKLAATVSAHQQHKAQVDNHMIELSNLLKSDAPDKKEKAKASIKRYQFVKDASGEITGAEVKEASDKPKMPGSLKG
jgi:hypothetical protein